MTVISAAVLLFMIMDPLGNVPLFLSALRDVPPHRHRRIILREMLIALAVLLLFLFAGQHILPVLGISSESLTVAGGIILFLIALRMIFPPPPASGSMAQSPAGEPLIVPLAVPLIAGPSSIATVMLIMNREPQRWPEWLLAIVIAWAVSGLILAFSSNLRRLLGERGLTAVERLMGLVLTAVAVEMFMRGVREFMLS